MTEAIDFARSFLWWRTDALEQLALTQTSKPPFALNNARVPLDCLCRIEDRISDAVQFFALGASCKTERVGVDEDIWMEPNADFIPVMSGTRFMALKTYHRAGIELPLEPPSLGYQSERQEVAIAREVFEAFIPAYDGNDAPRVAWLSTETEREAGAQAIRRMLEHEREAIGHIRSALRVMAESQP